MHWRAGSPYRASTSPCLPSASQLETTSIPAVVDPSLSLVPVANVVQMQATLAPSRMTCATLGCKSTRIRRDCSRRSCKAHCLEAGRREASGCQSPAHRESTTETARRDHPLLPLALLPTALPSMTGLAPPSNMFVMPPPPIQLQIDPALRATAPPQVTSAPLPSSSIDACANPQFASHMSSIFTEQWVTQRILMIKLNTP